jgi:PAS domain S-box-containing protein
MDLEVPCRWGPAGVANIAAELCAGTAMLAVSLVSLIWGAWCQKLIAAERKQWSHQELRSAAEREQGLMRIAELQTRVAGSSDALTEERRSRVTERESLVSFETQLRKASEDLCDCRRQLTELRASLDAASVPIISLDKGGHVSFWNQKAGEVCRCPLERALHCRLTEFLGSGDSTAFSPASIASSMSAPRGFSPVAHCQRLVIVRARSPGEVWQDVLLHISPRRSADGSVEGLFCIGQDLTKLHSEIKQAELAVKDLDRANAPIIAVNSSGDVTEWNSKAEALTGYTRAEAMGANFVRHFITEEWADGVRWMIAEGLRGEDITNFEFSLFTKGGQRLEILMSTSARRDRNGAVVGVIGVGKDITELRSESKMLANYVRICGAAVWSLRGRVNSGSVTECKTKEIEHLISQQAQINICDPRMVIWRASFVSILKTMCQNFWVRRKSLDEKSDKASTSTGTTTANTMEILGSSLGSYSSAAVSMNLTNPAIQDKEFGYEFCFEAANGSVKWYKVEGHLIEESLIEGKFEVTGSMQEVTSMWIDKVMGDRWQKWWSRMCHMVFDATLLVDTQEYRVLNAWGEEKVFGCKLQSHHPVLQLIKPEDTVSLKEAFNEVTFKGFERGRMLHLLRPGQSEEIPAQCFLLSADQENPNECMMGIRMQASEKRDGDEMLWDVAKPNQVLTLEDLARLKSGLKRHRRPTGLQMNVRPNRRQNRPRLSGAHSSSQSLCSIPEDLHGESDADQDDDDRASVSESVKSDTESHASSSKSSVGSAGTEDDDMSEEANSQVGICCSPPRSISEAEMQRMTASGRTSKPLGKDRKPTLEKKKPPVFRYGPPIVKLRGHHGCSELNLDEFATVSELRSHIQDTTKIPISRQTLILAGRRLPLESEEDMGIPPKEVWNDIKNNVRPGQTLMLIGSVPKVPDQLTRAPALSPAVSPDFSPEASPGLAPREPRELDIPPELKNDASPDESEKAAEDGNAPSGWQDQTEQE